MTVKNRAPRNIAITESGVRTTPRPIDNGLKGNFPPERIRVSSRMMPASAAITIEIVIDGVRRVPESPPNTAETRSDTPFHCIADGKPNCPPSWTIASWTRIPGLRSERKRRLKRGVLARAPARMPMQWATACCLGFAPSM